MVDGNKLGDVGFEKLGTPYSEMDCQAFIEWCLKQCGENKNLAGSNAWYREVAKNGVILSPEECVRELGRVPKGAFLFIHANDGKEPAKYKDDGMGNASHIGLCTIPRGEGAIHSSSSRGCVAESKFKEKTIKGGWNKVGLWNRVAYDYGGDLPVADDSNIPAESDLMDDNPTLRKGSKGEYVTILQTKLQSLGYNLGSWGVDGDFGRATQSAVMAFQRDRGLVQDGVCGPKTWAALSEVPVNGLYTVHIPNLTLAMATEFEAKYPNAWVTEDNDA